MEPIISMRGILKKFPPTVVANNNVDLDVYKGEIHAIVGENGAGKSTLMSILYGVYQPDKGQIKISGKKVNIKSPIIAIKHGIGMVFQHFMLVQTLTVAENVVLGREPRKGIFFDRKKAVKEVNDIAEKYGFKIDPYAKISELSVGMEQRVEIIKTIYRGAEIIILDEPTAVLTPKEVKELYQTLRCLTQQGKTIILITHKLKEVMTMSDRVSILRNGKLIGTMMTSETNECELANMMVGREVVLEIEKKECQKGNKILKLQDVHCKSSRERNIPGLNGVSMYVCKGEILGIAGVDGNGQTELLEVLTGLRKVTSGKILLDNNNITNKSSREIKKLKISHIPEDRHKRGLVLRYSVAENLILGLHRKSKFTKCGVIKYSEVNNYANELIEKFDIRTPSKDTLVKSLSGGNQQKVIIAREIYLNPDLLIASQPTRGVDVGAIEFIHKNIIKLRDECKGVLLISADLQEIMSLSDRIAVMFEGKIVAILDAKNATEEKLGLLMAGIHDAECALGKREGEVDD